jgi:ribosomal protein S18 acetylase RimI-like enzyme
MDFAIRQADGTDLQRIVDFQIDMAAETEDLQLDRPTVNLGVAAVLQDPSKGEYWVASTVQAGNEIVIGGLLLTFEWSDWRNGQLVWIQSVYIDSEFRRQGVFRSMLQHVQKLVAERADWRAVRLYVDNGNAAAQNTYKNLGMNGDHYRVFEWFPD